MTKVMRAARIGLWIALPVVAALGPLLAVGPVLGFRVAAVLAITLGALSAIRERRIFPEQRWILALTGLVAFSAAITWVWPRWPRSGLAELLSLLLGLLLAASVADHKERPWLWIARGVVLTVWVEAGIVLWEAVTGQHLPTFALTWEDDRYMGMWFLMAGSFANPNQLAHVIAICFPITVWAMLTEKQRLLRLSCLAALLFCPWIMWLTGSRLGLAVLCFELLVLFLLLRKGWLVLVGLAGIGLAAIGLFPTLLSSISPASGKEVDDARLNLALSAFHMLRQTYGLGVGPGGFAQWAVSPANPVDTYGLTNAHNAVLEVLSQYGFLVGIAAFLTVLRVVQKAFIVWRSDRLADRTLGLGVMSVLLCWPLIGMMNSQWMPLSWSVVELLLLAAAYGELRRIPVAQNAGTVEQ